jgi:regulator of RNase E activity RraA
VVLQRVAALAGQHAAVVGRARTQQLVAVRDRERAPLVRDRRFHFSLVDEAPPGVVLVIAAAPGPPFAVFGGLLAYQAARRGVAGVVVDGHTRDVPEITGLRLPVWCTGVTMMPGGYGGYAVVGVDVPVTCGGVEVQPGDIVAADDDGAIVIPAAEAERVLATCRAMEAAEAETRRRVDAGGSLHESFPSRDYYRPPASA